MSFAIRKIILLIFIVLSLLIVILATTGLSNPYFTRFAQASFQKIIGTNVQFHLQNAQLSLDGGGNLAFEAKNIVLTHASDLSKKAEIASVKMGFKAVPLLWGNITVNRVEINTARLIENHENVSPYSNPTPIDVKGLSKLVHHSASTLRNVFLSKNIDEIIVTNSKISPTLFVPFF
jgi:uncharacterized protein involved in outer membrane biogenesis